MYPNNNKKTIKQKVSREKVKKITEAGLVVKAVSMDLTHLISAVAVVNVLFLALFLLRQRLRDNKMYH